MSGTVKIVVLMAVPLSCQGVSLVAKGYLLVLLQLHVLSIDITFLSHHV